MTGSCDENDLPLFWPDDHANAIIFAESRRHRWISSTRAIIWVNPVVSIWPKGEDKRNNIQGLRLEHAPTVNLFPACFPYDVRMHLRMHERARVRP
jgi:hypothetical protein